MPTPEQKPRVCEECEKVAKEMNAITVRVTTIENGHSRMKEAFVKNDLGIPDYDGHRVSHYNSIEQARVVSGYKRDLTKRVLEWALVAVAVLIGQGAIEWIKGHIK